MTDTPPAENRPETGNETAKAPAPAAGQPAEHGGPKGPEPTRYQDWERGGRCVDF